MIWMEDKKTIKTRNLTRFPKLSVKIKSIMINYVGEGLAHETSASGTLHGGQLTLWNQLIKPLHKVNSFISLEFKSTEPHFKELPPPCFNVL